MDGALLNNGHLSEVVIFVSCFLDKYCMPNQLILIFKKKKVRQEALPSSLQI